MPSPFAIGNLRSTDATAGIPQNESTDQDETLVMDLSTDDDDEEEEEVTKMTKELLDWEAKHSADDEKTAERPRRARRGQGSGHRRTRSGDAAAASLMTEERTGKECKSIKYQSHVSTMRKMTMIRVMTVKKFANGTACSRQHNEDEQTRGFCENYSRSRWWPCYWFKQECTDIKGPRRNLRVRRPCPGQWNEWRQILLMKKNEYLVLHFLGTLRITTCCSKVCWSCFSNQ